MKRLFAAALMVFGVALFLWADGHGHAAGVFRYAAAGFPSSDLIAGCPLKQTYYGFEAQELIEIRCVGGFLG